APQTNEVRRSVALIPAYHAIAARFGLPLSIRELGASAGLNLNAWQYGLEAGGVHLGPHDAMLTLKPEWRGEEPLPASVTVASATGCDLSPIDLSREGEAQRLLCYIWPDQLQRVALIRAAIEIARQTGTVPERADAIDWLERQLAAHRPGEALVIQHTVAWQYFPAEAKARGEKLLADHGARASRAAPIARLSMENDGGEPGACLHLTLWPGDVGSDGERHDLGRVDFHGRWIDWRNPRFSAT
ncbi:MAG: DUF2332 domain-containing protein, partial [Hyphomicrobiales bacterium]|nr:DUF2332 domain-containing protein [Hyphomicrobiales bacterium]